jgi:periplasmic protein TonB
MTPLALHFPGRRGLVRWTLSAAAIIATHGAVIGSLVYWYTRTPPEEKIIPAIAVSIVPAAPVTPVEDETPVAAQEAMRIDPTPEQPKVEVKTEPPPEEIKPPPPPPRPAEVVLPKPEPKPVERKPVEKKLVEKKPVEKKPVEKKPPIEYRPAQEAREKAATREAQHQASVAASNAYASLVYGHLQRFKSRPANSATGHSVAHFVLSRTGNVLSVSIVQSSGNAALDAAALASVRNASPFPPFPAEKTGSQDGFEAPFRF